MTCAFRATRRIEFRDTDAAGIAHFSCFFHYMEEVEHAFLRQLGLSVVMSDEQGTMSWPRVAATCQYQGAVRFEDVLDIALRVTNLGSSSITYGFRFTHQGRQIAEGEIVAVCCRMEPGQSPRAIPIPAHAAERLAEARDRQDGQPAGDAE